MERSTHDFEPGPEQRKPCSPTVTRGARKKAAAGKTARTEATPGHPATAGQAAGASTRTGHTPGRAPWPGKTAGEATAAARRYLDAVHRANALPMDGEPWDLRSSSMAERTNPGAHGNWAGARRERSSATTPCRDSDCSGSGTSTVRPRTGKHCRAPFAVPRHRPPASVRLRCAGTAGRDEVLAAAGIE